MQNNSKTIAENINIYNNETSFGFGISLSLLIRLKIILKLKTSKA